MTARLAIVALIAAAMVVPAQAQRARPGTIKPLVQRAASRVPTNGGRAVSPGTPITISRTLPNGRIVDAKLTIAQPPGPDLRIVSASFFPATQTLVARIENKGTLAASEGALVVAIDYGAVDKQAVIAAQFSVLDDLADMMALSVNLFMARIAPLAPAAVSDVTVDLPDIAQVIAFCGTDGKTAKDDCVDPAVQPHLIVRLLSTSPLPSSKGGTP